MRRSGYKLLFALLVKPALAGAPVRTLAQAAAVSKSGAADVLNRLIQEGLIGRTTKGRQMLPHKHLIERWVTGYSDILRPSLMIGRYQSLEKDPFRLAEEIECAIAGNFEWAWGGGAAAFRLTGHFRGEQTTLHMTPHPQALARQLKLLPDRRGAVTILEVPGPLALEGAKEKTVHPLLVYAELITTGGEREGEAAAEIRELYLRDLL